jgi:DNA invertase Pin-like site-specific DNA recombinase
MKHVAVYLRVSTEGLKGGKEQTTGSQRLEIEIYLKSKGITDFVAYEDLGISGTKKDRPSLKKLMTDCRQGKVSMVVCYKMDRLFRSLPDLLETLAEFTKLSIEFVALKDGIDLSNATGRLMMQILGAFAEFEASVTKERVLSGLANAKAKGVKLGRPMKTGHAVVDKLKGEGHSVIEISNITGLSRQSIYRTLNKENRNEN